MSIAVKKKNQNLDIKKLLKENTSKCVFFFKFFYMSFYTIYNGKCNYFVKWTQNIMFYFLKIISYISLDQDKNRESLVWHSNFSPIAIKNISLMQILWLSL